MSEGYKQLGFNLIYAFIKDNELNKFLSNRRKTEHSLRTCVHVTSSPALRPLKEMVVTKLWTELNDCTVKEIAITYRKTIL